MKTNLEFLDSLTIGEKQLLKDTIRFGEWGRSTYDFFGEDDEVDSAPVYVYNTDDAKRRGNFSGLKCSMMFSSIYRKLCRGYKHRIGKYISNRENFNMMGSGDVLLIREEIAEDLIEWANEDSIQIAARRVIIGNFKNIPNLKEKGRLIRAFKLGAKWAFGH